MYVIYIYIVRQGSPTWHLAIKHPKVMGIPTGLLQATRKWHPDKWTVQGDKCVAIATEVAKQNLG